MSWYAFAPGLVSALVAGCDLTPLPNWAFWRNFWGVPKKSLVAGGRPLLAVVELERRRRPQHLYSVGLNLGDIEAQITLPAGAPTRIDAAIGLVGDVSTLSSLRGGGIPT